MNALPDGNGGTTEIGSVPDLDPYAAVDAITGSHAGRLMFVPEFPRRDPREGMLERVVCDGDGGLPSAERAAGLHAVLGSVTFHSMTPGYTPIPRLLKVAIAGPAILARSGRALNQGICGRIAGAIAAKGWQPVIQIDEPGTTENLSPSERESLAAVIADTRAAGAFVAIHDCGAVRGAELLALAPDMISVDATGPVVPLVGDGPALQRYLENGGSIIWGVVPTDGSPLPGRTAARLLLDCVASVLGDRDLVRRRAWLSPACGLGTLTCDRAEEIRRALRYAAGGWT